MTRTQNVLALLAELRRRKATTTARLKEENDDKSKV